MVIILLSGVQLAMENPLIDPKSRQHLALEIIDLITTVIFALEAIIKIISLGLVFNGKQSYLRNTWNIIDFLIAILSVTLPQ